MNCEEGEWRRRYWGSFFMFRKLCWGTSRFSVCASVRPSVHSFVRSSVTLQVYPCVEAIILWRCDHITMKHGTHVHHDVKCKLWKNKMAVTYISRWMNLETSRKCVSTTLMSRSALFGQNHNLAWRSIISYHDVHVYQVSLWYDHIFRELHV
jgi:hypothetical protein